MIVKFPSWEEFKIYLEEEKGNSTDSSLKSKFNFIVTYFKKKPFDKVNLRVMFKKLRTTTELKDILLKKQTLNKYLDVVQLIAHYLGINEFDYFDGYKIREDEVKPMGDLITDQEAKALCEVKVPKERNEKEHNLRFRAVLSLMRFVGTPPIDVRNLTWDHDKITHFDYHRQKTGKHMVVPIPPPVREFLDRLPHYPHNHIFGSQWGPMKRQTLEKEVTMRAKILGMNKHVTAYSFRGSAETWCYMAGKEAMLPYIADIFGHTMETAKKHYIRYKDPRVYIDALNACHPGLSRGSPVDTLKRIFITVILPLIENSNYEAELILKPKRPNLRIIKLS